MKLQSEKASPASKPKAAAVDDDPLLLGALGRALRDYDVSAFSNAAELLARVRAGERFDVIVSDLMMPGMTGADLFEALSSVAPEQAARMIIVSGGATTPAAHDFLTSGSVPVVAKPFEPRDLLALVREVSSEPAAGASGFFSPNRTRVR